MNKYYCKNCGSEAIKGDNARRSNDFVVYCPMCEDENGNEVEMEELPDYETPKQYKERMGKKWPDIAPVWWRQKGSEKRWRTNSLFDAKELEGKINRGEAYREYSMVILCAQSPEPPPDDWKPEGA